MRALWLPLAIAMQVACSPGPPTAPVDSDRTPAPDTGRGETLSLACQACHSLAAGGPHLVGPNLHGVFGRGAGKAPGFANYSEALQDADFVWTPALLDRWLEDPGGFLPGTTMAFTGYRSSQDRAALIAYLVQATAQAPD